MTKVSTDKDEVRNVHTTIRNSELLSKCLNSANGELKTSSTHGLMDLVSINKSRTITIGIGECGEHIHEILIQSSILFEINSSAVITIEYLDKFSGSELSNRLTTKNDSSKLRR